MNESQPRPASKFAYRAFLVSSLIALVCLAGIAAIWYRVSTAPPALYPGETMVTNESAVTQFMTTHVPPAVAGEEAPMYIPTGVVIQSVEFKGPYTLQVAGYVWQRYADGLPPDLDKMIVLPEAESTTFHKVYDTHQGNEQVIGWNFKATVREQFDYSQYPLDRQLIWLRIWSADFERNVYLVPDIAGYTTLQPEMLPGLDPGLVLENWQFLQSYFSFRLNRYNSNFGIAGYDAALPQPDLYFNVAIERDLLSALIARLVAPLLILLQLFVIVMVIGSDNKRLEQFGVRPGAVIFTCAAFFFAVLVAQNSLRDSVEAHGIVYLETVHILTYLVIFAVAANSVFLVALPNLGLFRENDNLWVEVLYWPVILFTLLVVTLWIFR